MSQWRRSLVGLKNASSEGDGRQKLGRDLLPKASPVASAPGALGHSATSLQAVSAPGANATGLAVA